MRLELISKFVTDVLVIGAGGAGLRAAIEAAKHQVKVTLISKGRVGYGSNTAISGGYMAAAKGWDDPRDNPESHFRDTLISGRFMNNQRLVEIMTERSITQIRDLESLGVNFQKMNSDYLVTPLPGHTYPRTLLCDNHLGTGLTLPLRKYAGDQGIQFIENTLVTRLLVSDRRVVGAIGYDKEGRILVFSTKAVVVAGGGCGHIFLRTNNAVGATGDSYALLYEAGVPLTDMEFVQFYPTAFGRIGSAFVMYEILVGVDRAPIKNSLGEDVVEKYGLRDTKLLTRDRLGQAMMQEILEGRSINGLLNLDLSRIPQDRLEWQRAHQPRRKVSPTIYPVAPTAHFFMGGGVINAQCETTIEGLYAAGEVCGGVHGANRLASNAITDIFVFGAIAGENAAKKSKASKRDDLNRDQMDAEIDRLKRYTSSEGREELQRLQHLMRETMWYEAGILRSRDSLTAALREIASLKERSKQLLAVIPRDLMKAVEFRNMLVVCEMICRAGLLRAESRGAHYRLDYRDENSRNWLKNIRITNRGGEMTLSTHQVQLATLTP